MDFNKQILNLYYFTTHWQIAVYLLVTWIWQILIVLHFILNMNFWNIKIISICCKYLLHFPFIYIHMKSSGTKHDILYKIHSVICVKHGKQQWYRGMILKTKTLDYAIHVHLLKAIHLTPFDNIRKWSISHFCAWSFHIFVIKNVRILAF